MADYNSKIIGKIDSTCHLGHELHVMTSDAFGTRVLGIRLNRLVPSATGHIGYTRQGFMLHKHEAEQLHKFLSEALLNETLWEVEEPLGSVIPIRDDNDD